MFSNIVQGISSMFGGSKPPDIGRDVLQGISSGLGQGIQAKIMGKINGIPSPSAGDLGRMQNEFLREAYPGMSQYDRTGAQGIAQQVAGKQQEGKNQLRLQQATAASNERIAKINAKATVGAAAIPVSQQVAQHVLGDEIPKYLSRNDVEVMKIEMQKPEVQARIKKWLADSELSKQAAITERERPSQVKADVKLKDAQTARGRAETDLTEEKLNTQRSESQIKAEQAKLSKELTAAGLGKDLTTIIVGLAGLMTIPALMHGLRKIADGGKSKSNSVLDWAKKLFK